MWEVTKENHYYYLNLDDKIILIGYIAKFDKPICVVGKITTHKWIGYIFDKEAVLDPLVCNDNPTIIFDNSIELIKLKFQMVAKELGWDIKEIK